jgi:hypothetical protein
MMSSIRYGAGNSPRELVAKKNAAKTMSAGAETNIKTAANTYSNVASYVTTAAKVIAQPKQAVSIGVPAVAAATPAGPVVNASMAVGKALSETSFGQKVGQFVDNHPYLTAGGALGAVAAIGGAGYYLGSKYGSGSSSSTGGSMAGKRKRMNPANKRALMKAVSRLKAYDNMDRTIDKAVKKALGRRKS